MMGDRYNSQSLLFLYNSLDKCAIIVVEYSGMLMMALAKFAKFELLSKGVIDLSPKSVGTKLVARNKKAFHDYSILEKFEAGVQLFGTEVKSVRQGNVNLRDSFCTINDGQLFARGLHISPYEKGNIFNRDPLRPKKLLMHKIEIRRLFGHIKQDGLTLIPLTVYFRDSLVKLEIGLARGKKLHDKRQSIADRDSQRVMNRHIKERM